MAATDLAALVVLNELMDSDDGKPRRGKTRSWIKRMEENGYFNNIIKFVLRLFIFVFIEAIVVSKAVAISEYDISFKSRFLKSLL